MKNIEEKLKGVEIYQDILINGSVYKKGLRNCKDRYAYIKSLITIKNRPFTVLDIGANFGYYSLKIAEDFPNAYVTMIQHSREALVLREILKANTNVNKRLCLLAFTMNKSIMNLLSQCEHFDYILCNNVLHHMPDYKYVYKYLKKACKYLIIETPPVNDNKSCGQNRLEDLYTTINKECKTKSTVKFQRHTNKSTYSHIYFFEFESVVYKQKGYFNSPKAPETDELKHIIYDDKRQFYKKSEDSTADYIYGINLFTFISLKGIYPLKSDIIKKFSNIKSEYKFNNTIRDITPWNFILNDNIYLIDVKNRIDGQSPVYNDKYQLDQVIRYIKKWIK